MTFSYLSYAVTELFCIIYTATILFRMNNSIGSEYEVRELRYMIFSYWAMLATDIIWALNEDRILHPSSLVNAAVNGICVAAVSFGCYFWYCFVEERLHPAEAEGKLRRFLVRIPITAIVVLDLISVFTGWFFYIDADGHFQNAGLFRIQSVVNYFYLLIPTIGSVIRVIRTKSKLQKTEFGTYAAYMVAPLIAGLCEDAMPTVPILALNIFMVLHLLFITIQDMQIFQDALTGLNNRRRLNQFLEERLPKASAESPVCLFMLDINRFKSINDVFGHVEGDSALKTFAGVMKKAAGRFNAFIARYGGDEFCFVTSGSPYRPEDIEKGFRELLQNEQAGKPDTPRQYLLTVSMGYTVSDNPESNADAVINRADRMLYENKRKWHTENA